MTLTNQRYFMYENHEIRAVELDGKMWWCLNDICNVLDLTSTSNVSYKVDKSERKLYPIATNGGEQNLIIVSESGLYKIIFSSRKPQAKKFRKYILEALMPSFKDNVLINPVL